MSDIPHIDIKEFREEGYLQEVNRQFLHPLGLALEVVQEEDGTERLGGVWDYRDDPEGIAFDEVDRGKARHVAKLHAARAHVRREALGYVVQPVPKAEKKPLLSRKIKHGELPTIPGVPDEGGEGGG